MNMPHLLVMAGGTGGHVFPALAVALELQRQGARITWLGTKRGLESRVIPENNIPIEWVSVEGLRGKSRLSLVLAPFKLGRALWQSLRIIYRSKPDCVLGMGGFVSGPGGLAAALLRKPLVIHEQNAVAGLTNKWLAKLATKVLTGFPRVADLPSTAQWVGNPVRPEIAMAAADRQAERKGPLNVLIIGGSQGAHSFNVLLPKVFSQMQTPICVWHQAGKGRRLEVQDLYLKEAPALEVKCDEFIDDMASAYQWADLLLCRAGAMTIAELCAAQKPALLVPYPFSAGDHQDYNAATMVNVGAALSLDNSELKSAKIVEVLTMMLADRSKLAEMGKAAARLHRADALDAVVTICQEYLHA